MLFDTHAHYDYGDFDKDREEVLASLQDADVCLVVDPGCDIPTSRKSLEIAESHPFVYSAVGVHPNDCSNLPKDWVQQLREMAAHPKVVAIGEAGLDYYRNRQPKDLQAEVFRAQLDLARELNLPIIIHDREAHGDTMDIIREYPDMRGVFHCYSGSAEMAKELVRMGWYISFTGVITYDNARKVLEAVEAVPLDRLMVETDSPFLSPEPVRKTRNWSANVAYTARKMAEVKGISYEECCRITLENGCRFFSIPLPEEAQT